MLNTTQTLANTFCESSSSLKCFAAATLSNTTFYSGDMLAHTMQYPEVKLGIVLCLVGDQELAKATCGISSHVSLAQVQ